LSSEDEDENEYEAGSGSRLTQSTIGSETATEWMEFGAVRASVVARVPPMREPRREIFGRVLFVKLRRMC
jgi:hypothetical protein